LVEDLIGDVTLLVSSPDGLFHLLHVGHLRDGFRSVADE